MNLKLNGKKDKKEGPRRVYKKVSDKTINVYTSAALPKVPSINPLYGIQVARSFALAKKSVDKLGTPLKKSNSLLWIAILGVIAVVAIVVILMFGSGGGGNAAASGGGGLPGPLGSLSKLGENFNLPGLSGAHH